VAYGPHERNVLDFWKAPTEEPAPVVVFIHGGGFLMGSKDEVRRGQARTIRKCLEAGISFAAISYRLRTTTTLDEIMRDCGRAVQFLRSKAEDWNIDGNRIGAYGSSAGGGASLWLAVHDDLADPESEDPVLRESTRLTAAGHLNSQATYDCERWSEYIDLPPNWTSRWSMGDDLAFYGVTTRAEVDSPKAREIRKRIDMLSFLDAGDPPLFVHNVKSHTPPRNRDEVIHHPLHAVHLAARCQEVGIDVTLVTRNTPPRDRAEVVDFFIERLLPKEAARNETDGG